MEQKVLSYYKAHEEEIFEDLKKLGVVMKRAQYFIVCKGKVIDGLHFTQDGILRGLITAERPALPMPEMEQLSLF